VGEFFCAGTCVRTKGGCDFASAWRWGGDRGSNHCVWFFPEATSRRQCVRLQGHSVGGGRRGRSSFDALDCTEGCLRDSATSPSKMSFHCSAASLHQVTHPSTTPSKHSLSLQPRCLPQPEPSLPGVCQQERSSRLLGGQGLFSETPPSGQLLVGGTLRTFPDDRGYKRTVFVRIKNGVVKRPIAKLFLPPASAFGQLMRAAPSMRGLAVKRTVRLLQRQPLLPQLWTVFRAGGNGSSLVTANYGLTLFTGDARTLFKEMPVSLALSRRGTTRRECLELFNVVCACRCSLHW